MPIKLSKIVLAALILFSQIPGSTVSAEQELTATSDFIITLPWADGVEHTIAGGYGSGLHTGVHDVDSNNDHYALDLDFQLGEAVYPVAAGTVRYAGPAQSLWAGYGNFVFIEHTGGYQSLYAHLNDVFVEPGQTVSTSTRIGGAGNTGTRGVHLHMALYRGANFTQGPYGGEAIRPEPFQGCTKVGGGICQGLRAGDRLWKGENTPLRDLWSGGVTLQWDVPLLAAEYRLQVVPLNGDGPAIDIIVSDPAMVAAGEYRIPAPQLGAGNYTLLPGATYSWRVGFSMGVSLLALETEAVQWSDTQWFRTASPNAQSITIANPNRLTSDRTPTIRWSDSNASNFYYEVQMSTDSQFRTGSDAVSAVYWNLVHGGVTSPLNSWTVPGDATLDPDVYFVRVRQRVQATPAGGQEQGIGWTNPVALTIINR